MSKSEGYKARYKARGSGRERDQAAPSTPALAGTALESSLASQYGRDEYGEWIGPKLYPGQVQTQDKYVDGSEGMNGYLRKGEKLPSNYEALRLNMESLRDSKGIVLDQDIIVYRGVNAQVGRTFKPGATVEDKGWISTTTKPKIAKGFTGRDYDGPVKSIRIPKGTRIVAFGGYEGEIVLSPGKFKVGADGVMQYGG